MFGLENELNCCDQICKTRRDVSLCLSHAEMLSLFIIGVSFVVANFESSRIRCTTRNLMQHCRRGEKSSFMHSKIIIFWLIYEQLTHLRTEAIRKQKISSHGRWLISCWFLLQNMQFPIVVHECYMMKLIVDCTRMTFSPFPHFFLLSSADGCSSASASINCANWQWKWNGNKKKKQNENEKMKENRKLKNIWIISPNWKTKKN